MAIFRLAAPDFCGARGGGNVRGDGKSFVAGVSAKHPPNFWRAGLHGPPVLTFRRRPFGFAQGKLAAGSGEPAPRLGTAHYPWLGWRESNSWSMVLGGNRWG